MLTEIEKQRILTGLADPRFDVPRVIRRALEVIASRGPMMALYACIWTAAGVASTLGLSPEDLTEVIRGINAKVALSRESRIVTPG